MSRAVNLEISYLIILKHSVYIDIGRLRLNNLKSETRESRVACE